MATRYITKNLNQTITYWANPTSDGWGGSTFDTPVAITGRWEDRQELYRDADGQEVLSHAVVFVGQDVDIKGYLYLGTSVAANPKNVDGAREIKSFRKIPNLKATAFARKAWL